VTAHAVLGLAALNLLFLLAGLGLLAAARGFDTWGEVLRLSGVAYLVGTAATVVLATEVLVFGGPVTVPAVSALALVVAAVCAVVAVRLRRPRPRWQTRPAHREPLLLVGVLTAALAAVCVEAFYRVAHLQGPESFDGWAFWTTKAKAIYFFGGLDEHLFRTLPGATYPIFLPTLQAIDFHFMGSADTVTVHLQNWLLLVGFVGAVAGLLRPRIPLVLVWPFLLVMLVMPEFGARALQLQADIVLDYFFVGAALALALWLIDREDWLLLPYGVLLAAAMSTKREGQLFAGCLVAAALLATWRDKRGAWPRIVGVAALAFVFEVPWRIWFSSRHLGGETPGASPRQLWDDISRIPSSVRIVLTLLFDTDLWLIAVPLGLAAAAVLLIRRWDRIAVFYLLLMLFTVAGFTWILWSITVLPLETSKQTPIPRAVGADVLVSLAFAPLLLARAFRRRRAGG
jgi:hypothetical protein